MPIYEYRCADCEKMTEAYQQFSDVPLTTCKHCQGQLHKIISSTSFQLKGSGWYVTDYARGGKGKDKEEKEKEKEKE
ncbi:MAG: FmdB family zinc ribbon protein [Pseudomonadota bacterium]